MHEAIVKLVRGMRLNASAEIEMSDQAYDIPEEFFGYISGASVNIDCTNTHDCTHTKNQGNCKNEGTCIIGESPIIGGS